MQSWNSDFSPSSDKKQASSESAHPSTRTINGITKLCFHSCFDWVYMLEFLKANIALSTSFITATIIIPAILSSWSSN